MKKIRKYSVLFAALAVFFSILIASDAYGSRPKKTFDEAAYANFRNVRAGMIGENTLYRSQHPANGSSRSLYANKLAELHDIQTVLNLSDSEETLLKYFRKENISPSYYYRGLFDRGSVFPAHLSIDYERSSYCRKVADGMRFLTRNRGPYLVHCEIGRDRTGFVLMLLESLMGAPYRFILDDYARSYVNVQGCSLVQAQGKAARHLGEELSYISGKSRKTDWSRENLAGYAAGYLKKGGMTEGEIEALKRNLSESYPAGGIEIFDCAGPGEDTEGTGETAAPGEQQGSA